MSAHDPLHIAVLITESPSRDVRGTLARRLIAAASAAGHRVQRVYFYFDGAYAALDGDVNRRWRELARSVGCELHACIASAERRGITRETINGFELQGLTGWLDEALSADRVLRF